jgi:hypothetical protein
MVRVNCYHVRRQSTPPLVASSPEVELRQHRQWSMPHVEVFVCGKLQRCSRGQPQTNSTDLHDHVSRACSCHDCCGMDIGWLSELGGNLAGLKSLKKLEEL